MKRLSWNSVTGFMFNGNRRRLFQRKAGIGSAGKPRSTSYDAGTNEPLNYQLSRPASCLASSALTDRVSRT